MKNTNSYDKAVKSISNSDGYEFSGESEYSRERSDPYEMVDFILDNDTEHEKNLTDSEIKVKIQEVLFRDTEIDFSNVEIDVHLGYVFLKGRVNGWQVKKIIELTLKDFPGVKEIKNELSYQ